jgi:glycosyltransferase involved in cell wall biosynthesis
LCSESEGFPQTILEYMAVGLPVIATRVGGIPELVVDGETGLIVPPNNPIAFASALRNLVESPAISERMGQAGQKRVREFFSLDSEILAHVSVYQYLAKKWKD